jgi:hypothetical protein
VNPTADRNGFIWATSSGLLRVHALTSLKTFVGTEYGRGGSNVITIPLDLNQAD